MDRELKSRTLGTTPVSLPRSRSANGLAYHRCGNGKSVVLLHGVGLRAESWMHQLKALEKTNTVFAIDMPGHGESPALQQPRPSLAQFTGELHTFVAGTVREPVVIAGHSMGALIALDFAARFPELCDGVAALNAVYKRSSSARTAVKSRAKALQIKAGTADVVSPITRWFGNSPTGTDRDMAEFCRLWLMDANHEGYAAAYSVFADEDGPAEQALCSLSMPALFLTATEDANSTPAMSKNMASLVPDGEALIVNNARHLVQLTHPQEVNAALCAFVADCEERSATRQARIGV